MPSSIFWLYGGAGAGKSALAQSLSEKFHKKELAATFFFFRSDSTRNDGSLLIPTLVSQLANIVREFVPLVEDRIRKDWDLFTKLQDIQIQELLVEPLLSLKSTNALVSPPRLIVIDGLDECAVSDIQCMLLRAIAQALPHIPYPLRFLITSRPEAHITHIFNHDPLLRPIRVQRYNLSDDPDADMDIRNFFEKEFEDIKKVHRLGHLLPQTWPDQEAITSLVERSSKHFVYASTVIRYIRSPQHRPDDRLEVILRLRSSQEGDRPYAQLDALYGLIFEGVESRVHLEKICLVLGILYFQSKEAGFLSAARDCTTIEALLDMKTGDLILLLDPILSLVAIDGDEIRIYHKSLFDYLLDFVRGGHLPFDLYRVHETAATYILTQKIAKAACSTSPLPLKYASFGIVVTGLSDFRHFAFHCQYGYLNTALKSYLFSLDVPCPKFLPTSYEPLPSWTDEQCFLLHQSIWHFLRTLARPVSASLITYCLSVPPMHSCILKDFNSNGQIYEQYLKKWMSYLHSVMPKRSQLRSKSVLSSLFPRSFSHIPAENFAARMADS